MLVSYHLNKQGLEEQVKLRILEVNNLMLATKDHVPLSTPVTIVFLWGLCYHGVLTIYDKKKEREKAKIHSTVHSRTGSNKK